MGWNLGGIMSNAFGSTNRFQAQSPNLYANNYQYGGHIGGADEASLRYRNAAEQAQNRAPVQADFSGAQPDYHVANQWQGNAATERTGQNNVASLMYRRATGQTPSIAEMEGRRQMGQVANAQASEKASARGPAGLALASQTAANNTANAQQQIAAQTQVNAANERLQAEQAAEGAYTGVRGQDITQQGLGEQRGQFGATLNTGQQQFNAGLGAQQRALNDQYSLGMTGNEMGVNNAQLTAGMNYGAQASGNSLQSQQINASVAGQNAATNQKNGEGILGTVASVAGGLFGLSDMRSKNYLPMRADGGPVDEGRATIVGERGPEIIIPKHDGYVIPNDRIQPLMHWRPEGGASMGGVEMQRPPRQMQSFHRDTAAEQRATADAEAERMKRQADAIIAGYEAGKRKSATIDPTMAMGQTEAGNIDLHHRPVVHNPDGSISTVRSMGVNVDGQEVLIPTVSPEGHVLSDRDAIGLYHRTGQHLGKFTSPEASTAYAKQLHEDQAREYSQPPAWLTQALERDGTIPPLLARRANGGPVRGGQPVIVGDGGGPEAFVNGGEIDQPQAPPAWLERWKAAEDRGAPVSTWGTGRGITPAQLAAQETENRQAWNAEKARDMDRDYRLHASTAMAVPGLSPGVRDPNDPSRYMTGAEPLQRADRESLDLARAREAEGIEPTEDEARKLHGAQFRLRKEKKAEGDKTRGNAASDIAKGIGEQYGRQAAGVDTSYHGPGGYAAPQLLALPGRAMGGMVGGGQPYMVGEQGPEVLTSLMSRNGGSMGGSAAMSDERAKREAFQHGVLYADGDPAAQKLPDYVKEAPDTPAIRHENKASAMTEKRDAFLRTAAEQYANPWISAAALQGAAISHVGAAAHRYVAGKLRPSEPASIAAPAPSGQVQAGPPQPPPRSEPVRLPPPPPPGFVPTAPAATKSDQLEQYQAMSDERSKRYVNNRSPLADAARSQEGAAYTYKREFTPPGEEVDEIHVGPRSAQNMARDPIARTVVKERADGMLMLDPVKLGKLNGAINADQQRQIDELVMMIRGKRGRK